jgi:uncharacterized membrane protein YczE
MALFPPPRSRRGAQLLAGLALYGFSDALMVEAGLGLSPWEVLHQGLSESGPLTIGQWTIAVGLVVLLAWFPLRQRPGLGTVANVVVIGLVLDACLAVLPAPEGLGVRGGWMVAGLLLNGVATAVYIGAGLGPGPRDGLMTGLAARGHSVGAVRTGIEVGVLVVGFLLGGTVGLGTALYAFGIGPVVHVLLPRLAIDREVPALREPVEAL